MFRKIVIPFLLLIPFSTLFSQELKQDPVLIKKKLENGLTYYIYPTDKVKNQAYFRLFLKVGSLQEKEEQRGLAHFMEHMAFNGIKHFEKNELISFLESKGAKFGHDMNAHTSYNETIFKLKLPTDDPVVIDSTITILADWANGILLDSTEVEKERGVVLSEWRSKQNVNQKSQEVFLNELLNGSRYTDRKVIGDTAVLKHSSQKDLRSFYEKWYDPSLMAVAIAGDVDPEKIEELIVKKFADLASSNPQPQEFRISDYSQTDFRLIVDKGSKKTELNVFKLIPPLVHLQNEKKYKKYLQKNLLNKLVEERFANLSFKDPAYNDASLSIGNFFPSKAVVLATAELNPDSISAGITALFEKTEQIYRYGFTSDEIEKIKTSFISNFERELQKEEAPSPASVIDEMHEDFFNNNKIITKQEEFRLATKYLPQLDSISFAKSIKAYTNGGHNHYLLVTNSEGEKKMPSQSSFLESIKRIQKKEIPRYANKIVVPSQLLKKEPKIGSILSETKIPEIEATELKLSNDVKVIYKQSQIDKNNLIISGFRKGGLYSLDSLNYINGIYADPVVSLSGYGDFSREALSLFLAGKKAKVLMLADKTRTGFYANSNVENAKLLFQLLYLKWTQPRVDKDLYNVLKKRSIQNIENKNPSAAEIFGKELKYTLSGKNYVTKELTKNDLEEKLEKKSILKAYKHFFGAANNYTISIISDQPLETMKPFIFKYIGGLPSGDVKTGYVYKNRNIIFKKDLEFIRATGETPKAMVSLIYQQNDPIEDFQALELKNKIIKNIIKNQLLQRLREDLGAVYGVSVSVSATKHPNFLSRQTISFSCEPARAEELIQETQKILNQLAFQKVDFSKEMEKIKTNLIKTHAILKQRNSYWTKAVRDFYFDEYNNWDFVKNYDQNVDQISEEEIAEKIKKYFIITPSIKAILYPKKVKSNLN